MQSYAPLKFKKIHFFCRIFVKTSKGNNSAKNGPISKKLASLCLSCQMLSSDMKHLYIICN